MSEEQNGLPPGWATANFGELLHDSQNGCSARRGTGEPTVVLRLADISSTTGEVATDALRQIALDLSDREKYALAPGDLLAFRVNGSKDIAGKVIEYRGIEGHTFCDHFIRMRVNESALVPTFAASVFHAPAARRQVERNMVSSAGQNTVSQGTMKAVEITLPPLNEQKRIVAKIEALQHRSDAAKAALDAIPPLLEKFRQSVLAAAFLGDLTQAWRAQNPDAEPATALLERIRAERRARWIEAAAEKARARAEAKATKAGKPWPDEANAPLLERERAKAAKKYKAPEPVDTEGLPELPEGWCWASVDELAWSVRNGVSKRPVGSDGVPILRISAVRPQDLRSDDIRYLPGVASEYQGYFLDPGPLCQGD